MKTIQSSLGFFALSFILVAASGVLATPIINAHIEDRSTQTCADPSLKAVPIEQAFNPSLDVHAIVALPAYLGNTAGMVSWPAHNPIFLAWTTPQEFTAPFYLLVNPSTNDYQTLISADGSPPSAPGYVFSDIRGYAYTTQVCGSVPLYGAFNSALGKDHVYTTLVNVHSQLVTISGWEDLGVVFYVLPLTSGSD